MYNPLDSSIGTLGEPPQAHILMVGNYYDHGYDCRVWLYFIDPDLNPPDSKENGWEVGYTSASAKPSSHHEDEAKYMAQEFYDFLMNFRLSYGNEDTILKWVRRHEDAQDKIRKMHHDMATLTAENEALRKRVAALETDYVKSLEQTNLNLIGQIRKAMKILEC